MVSLAPRDEHGGGVARVRILVRGAVQGVGFRPFAYRLAREMGLRGWVRNTPRGATLEVEGPAAELDRLARRLRREAPAPARVRGLELAKLEPVGLGPFAIRESETGGETQALLLADRATCDECRDEVFTPGERRYRYPFTNCTRCGPRYTIAEALPWDRAHTSMARFPPCADCRREYADPEDRRFHAEPIACPRCGPRLELWTPDGEPLARGDAALRAAVEALAAGRVVAVKGLGGFHLTVDANSAAAVASLRRRKRREEKPFAVLCDLATAERCCHMSPAERALLLSPEAPIVLLERRVPARGPAICEAVAPANPTLGVMRPYTPLHLLLVADFAGPLVATSGNLSDEPICIDEREALERLRGVADLFLVHDRPILRPVDDSVARICLGRPQLLRRARGYAPLPLPVPPGSEPVLAVGAHQKSSVALGIGGDAFVSQHLGDLLGPASHDAFGAAISGLETLYAAHPARIAADAHPDYFSTRYARERRAPVLAVQHHHAHVEACRAEHRLEGDLLGVAWDGSGWGPDGTVWGGELLVSGGAGFRRVACLRRFPLPGGEAAAREPRRAALGVLHALLGTEAFGAGELAPLRAFAPAQRRVLAGMLEAGLRCPVTSSAGRLFDAAASLLGLAQRCGFEGQAAMRLEHAARGARPAYLACPVRAFDPELDGVPGDDPATLPRFVVDWGPLVRDLLEGLGRLPVASLARGFHEALAAAIAEVAERIGLERVVLTGGCFQNRLLTERAAARLRAAGHRPYWHRRIPPNDGGIAYGQLAVLRSRPEA